MDKDMRVMIDKVKNFMTEGYTTEPFLFVYDKNDNIVSFNIPLNDKDALNKVLYDEKGNIVGGYGMQLDDYNKYLQFKSIQDIQKWFDNRKENQLLKSTKNDNYPDLSNIALKLRKDKDIYYHDINRGSCFKFAKEINKLGYKKFTFIFSEEEQEVIHVYIKLTNNLYWDADGFHSKSEIKSDYEIGLDNTMFDSDIDELNHHCGIDTYQALTTIPISNSIWKKIIQIIRES